MGKNDNFKIYCENCLTAFKKLPDKSVDLIATDPPYFLAGMGEDWSDEKLSKKVGKARAIGGLPVGMKFDPNQGIRLQSFFFKVSQEAIRVLKPGGFLIAFSQPRLFHRMTVASEDAGFEIRDMLIWEHNGGQGKAFTQDHWVKKMDLNKKEKDNILKKLDNRKTPQLRPMFESIMMAQKPKDGTFVDNWIKWNTGLIKNDFGEDLQQSTVLNYKKPSTRDDFEHMTVKPLDLMERIIDIFTIEGQVVLDPFTGSGTTGVAALNKKRKFIGFEIEPKYVNITVNRLKEI